MASLKIEIITVGEQITVEQLIEKRKVMTISKAMIMNIGITSVSSRPKLSRPGFDRIQVSVLTVLSLDHS